MRATDLGFRSPKEKTAEFNLPSVTFDGRVLPILHVNPHPTFSRSRRFSQYDLDARKTGEKAGPGAYKLIPQPGEKWQINGTPLYKELHKNVDTGDNGYLFVGNSLQYETSFVNNRRKSLQEHSNDGYSLKDSTRKSSAMRNTKIYYKSYEHNEKFIRKIKEKEPTEDSENTKETYRDCQRKVAIEARTKSASHRSRNINKGFFKSPYLMSKVNKIAIKMRELQTKNSL
ncbi:hypothetical protein SteCoe_900 [Stentor coeruleus]|uniref:Uncharacterized protein n=1 Tax=Stentor coeruleus TaxID=5963 RepID=A0A1R2D304_9CILI|nr:hypothetical protein SteCoe_900 [Stentor coeruleus]